MDIISEGGLWYEETEVSDARKLKLRNARIDIGGLLSDVVEPAYVWVDVMESIHTSCQLSVVSMSSNFRERLNTRFHAKSSLNASVP